MGRVAELGSLGIMRTLTYIILVVLCGILVSCKKQEWSKLTGNYEASRGYGSETLVLLTNGTYLQTFITRTTAHTNTGTWQFLPATQKVVLTNALIFDDGKGNPATMVVTNDWTLSLTNLAGILLLEDRQAQPFSKY